MTKNDQHIQASQNTWRLICSAWVAKVCSAHPGVRFLVAVLVTAAAILLLPDPKCALAAPGRVPPLPGQLLRAFDADQPDWLPGHRGVDIAGLAGDTVRSASSGKVTYVGVIAGVGIISITHPDGTRATYQPVRAAVFLGSVVGAGQPIGELIAGHDGCAQACLHWGMKAGERYLNPQDWLANGTAERVRLLPLDAKPRKRLADAPVGLASGSLPVVGTITSPFGTRLGPTSGVSEFHDGVDIAAPCDTPVTASVGGLVNHAGWAGGYGQRVEIGGSVSFSHLSAIAVQPGQEVSAGDVIGFVGSTGNSTGCHLHYSIKANGRYVDPLG